MKDAVCPFPFSMKLLLLYNVSLQAVVRNGVFCFISARPKKQNCVLPEAVARTHLHLMKVGMLGGHLSRSICPSSLLCLSESQNFSVCRKHGKHDCRLLSSLQVRECISCKAENTSYS